MLGRNSLEPVPVRLRIDFSSLLAAIMGSTPAVVVLMGAFIIAQIHSTAHANERNSRKFFKNVYNFLTSPSANRYRKQLKPRNAVSPRHSSFFACPFFLRFL